MIFGSLSSIPREQPVRDNLEAIAAQSRELAEMRAIVDSLRPEVEATVEQLFGRTLFFERPSVKRLTAWRAKAQQAAAERSGYAFVAYGQVKFTGIIAALAEKLKATGPIDIDVIIKGAGGGRDSAIRSLVNHGFNLLSIRDVTPIPHNGPRPRKPRRV